MYIKQIYFAVGFKEPSCRYFSPFLLCLLVICLASSLFLFLSFLILSNLFMFPQCFILWALLSFCFRLWWLGLIRQSVKICRRHSLKAYSHPFHLTNSTFVFPLYIARAQAIFGDTNTESIGLLGLKFLITMHNNNCRLYSHNDGSKIMVKFVGINVNLSKYVNLGICQLILTISKFWVFTCFFHSVVCIISKY